MKTSPPVIFVGMHRSGTSLLGRHLERLGLFVGKQKEGNNESLFFLRLNEWLMAQCGARWDMPEAMQYLWENEQLLTLNEDYIRHFMRGPRSINFLGIKAYAVGQRIGALNIPWGWKDPRNTYTLPLWLRIFPDARILAIRRHGVDVAKSLQVRSEKTLMKSSKLYEKYKKAIAIRPKRGGFVESPRCADLERSLDLWAQYNHQLSNHLRALEPARVLDIRYEDLLQDPVKWINKAAQFCHCIPTQQQLEKLERDVDKSRAYSYKKDPDLVKFASKHKGVLSDYGYDTD